jgi:glycerol kinase
MRWLIENVDGLDKNEDLVFGTIEAYLIAKLTG